MRIFVRDKVFYRRLLAIGAPIAAQQMITVGVNMLDTIMLGQLNDVALSASSVGVQIHNLFHYMTMGMGMGASVLIARFWGAKEEKSLQKTLTLMYRLCIGVALAFSLLAGLMPSRLLRLMTPDQAVIAEGVRYLRWSLPCFLLFGLSMTTTLVLRNIGKMHIPLLSAIGALFVNVFFNWMFIFGKLGAPAMGVAGAALGTLISRAFEFLVICGYFFIKEKQIRFHPIRGLLQPAGDLFPEYMRISMPVLVSDTLLGLGNSVTITVAGYIGTVYMAANTITNVTQQLTTVFSAAIGQAAVIITGNVLGEGNSEKAKEQGYTFAALGLILGLLCGIIVVAISPWVISTYQVSRQTKDVAMELFRAVGFTAVFMAEGSVLTKGVLRGGGDTRFLMIADVIFLWLVSIPLGAMAGLVWNWPPFFVFLLLRIDHLIKSVICLFRLRTDKWIKKIKSVPEKV